MPLVNSHFFFTLRALVRFNKTLLCVFKSQHARRADRCFVKSHFAKAEFDVQFVIPRSYKADGSSESRRHSISTCERVLR